VRQRLEVLTCDILICFKNKNKNLCPPSFYREWFTEFLKECPTGELTKKKVRQRHSFCFIFTIQSMNMWRAAICVYIRKKICVFFVHLSTELSGRKSVK